MTKDEQIEERGDLALIAANAIRDWQDRRYACNEEGLVEVKERLAESIAAAVLANGYRKQSEGEWVRSESKFGFGQSRCSICDGYVEGYTSYRFCPHCGAKIVGIKEEKIR